MNVSIKETVKVALAVASLASMSTLAATMDVDFLAGERRERRPVSVEERADGLRLAIKAAELDGCSAVEITPPFQRAKKGEPGHWVLPNNLLGAFTRDNGVYELPSSCMSFWGMKTPRKTFVAQVLGMKWDYAVRIAVTNGDYSATMRFTWDGRRPYEDIVIDWTFLPDSADYPDMARVYRNRRLENKEIVPLAERVKAQKPLEVAAKSVEVRIRSAWKTTPPPVEDQNDFNEPPLTVGSTFDRSREFIEACAAADIRNAEFCLAGWKYRGHDGRYPQIWPVEPQLGGVAALRKLVAAAKGHGYNIVLHNNHTDAYTVADCWDEGDLIHAENGDLVTDVYMWSGGRPYKLCLQRAWERFVVKDLAKIASLGMSGLHYIDVITVAKPYACFDPRHPCTKADTARWMGRILGEARKRMGGSSSEGAYDFCAGDVDCVLYVSYETPGGKKLHPMADRLVPMWQLVYHGIILSMPFTECTNYTIKDNEMRLSLVEFGGRPMFYVNSDYMTGLRWMGKEDLHVYTQDDMEKAVAAIKKGHDEYARLSDLQYAFMDGHDLVAPGVTVTRYSNGSEVVVNRSAREVRYRDEVVPALDWRRFDNCGR